MPDVHATPPRNGILAALLQEDFARLLPHLEPVSLPLRQQISDPGASIHHVYFLEEGLVSLLTFLADGAWIEVGMVGKEGLAGAPVLLGADDSLAGMVVQIAGTGLRISSGLLREEMRRSPTLMTPLLRFVQALHIQVSQTAACNGRHTVRQRLARWLLMAFDRVESDHLPFSHELLSTMLGVRRSGVTAALAGLRTTGIVRTSPGYVNVLSRPGLERVACECYRVVRQEYERLLNREN